MLGLCIFKRRRSSSPCLDGDGVVHHLFYFICYSFVSGACGFSFVPRNGDAFALLMLLSNLVATTNQEPNLNIFVFVCGQWLSAFADSSGDDGPLPRKHHGKVGWCQRILNETAVGLYTPKVSPIYTLFSAKEVEVRKESIFKRDHDLFRLLFRQPNSYIIIYEGCVDVIEIHSTSNLQGSKHLYAIVWNKSRQLSHLTYRGAY